MLKDARNSLVPFSLVHHFLANCFKESRSSVSAASAASGSLPSELHLPLAPSPPPHLYSPEDGGASRTTLQLAPNDAKVALLQFLFLPLSTYLHHLLLHYSDFHLLVGPVKSALNTCASGVSSQSTRVLAMAWASLDRELARGGVILQHRESLERKVVASAPEA